MSEVQFCNIEISEVEDKGNRVSITSGKNKFSFFKVKQDQTPTAAATTFQSLQVMAGKMYTVGVTESEPKQFVNDKEENITFTYHNIVLFQTLNPKNQAYQKPTFQQQTQNVWDQAQPAQQAPVQAPVAQNNPVQQAQPAQQVQFQAAPQAVAQQAQPAPVQTQQAPVEIPEAPVEETIQDPFAPLGNAPVAQSVEEVKLKDIPFN